MKSIFFITIVCSLFSGVVTAHTCSDVNDTPGIEDYVKLSEGQMLHLPTNLVFTRCFAGNIWNESNESCTAENLIVQMTDAVKYAEESNYAGYDEWRLPNIKELLSVSIPKCQRIFPRSIFPPSADNKWDRLSLLSSTHADEITVRKVSRDQTLVTKFMVSLGWGEITSHSALETTKGSFILVRDYKLP